jgi:hypothetical protein
MIRRALACAPTCALIVVSGLLAGAYVAGAYVVGAAVVFVDRVVSP